jgi:coenzyme Q-binding protein COQ10
VIRRGVQGTLPYPCEEVFTVVADVERYPEFVPGWREARVLERGTRGLRVEQDFGVGPARWRFESEARFDPPRAILIQAHSGPFESLTIDWRFAPLGDRGCRLALEVAAKLRSRMLERLYGAVLDRQATELWDVFAHRVAALHAAGSTGS